MKEKNNTVENYTDQWRNKTTNKRGSNKRVSMIEINGPNWPNFFAILKILIDL